MLRRAFICRNETNSHTIFINRIEITMSTIKTSEIKEYRVSTVRTFAGGAPLVRNFMFSNADYAEETPWPFETMVFRGSKGVHHTPHATIADAIMYHEKIVKAIENNMLKIGFRVKEPNGNPTTTREEWLLAYPHFEYDANFVITNLPEADLSIKQQAERDVVKVDLNAGIIPVRDEDGDVIFNSPFTARLINNLCHKLGKNHVSNEELRKAYPFYLDQLFPKQTQ